MKSKKMTDAYKNAIGTVFLLAGAFFICSTLLSMRTVLADPIAPTNAAQAENRTPRIAPGRNKTNSRSTVARVTATGTGTRSVSASSRGVNSRSIGSRGTGTVAQKSQGSARTNTANRAVTSRRVVSTNNNNMTMRGTAASRNNNRVVARTATGAARVGMLPASTNMRASTGATKSVTYLTNKLYTGNYSNIIDSTTGLISADAYSNCLEGYYTCMDEICTARSDTKGRCSCAGRATNFLAAETALEKANEELIQLSGQLALLIANKGKDVSEAFKLTDAEKVMNCVSYKETQAQYGTTSATPDSTKIQEWCFAHGFYTATCSQPDYCKSGGTNGNDFGFDIDNMNGSSSDILASLKAWADAKDLAKQYTENDTDTLLTQTISIGTAVNALQGVTDTVDTDAAKLDGLANKWGYDLFEYAHNNVCGRVLDSCFNGIYEACGTPPSGTDSMGHKIGKCANGASSSCPYNYNSAISVTTTGDGTGEVALNERGSTGSTTSTSATCFGYTSSSGDPYASLRGPVADARRSIMQKYLLDSNAACDTYGTALKNTAQKINYQKIAAEQALQQKRLEFYNEEQTKIENEAIAAFTNFNECISEIWDCYNEMSDEENWTTARIKTYCAQVANVPHCYEPMICKPSIAQFNAIIDGQDKSSCNYSSERDGDNANTCRNVVTLNEILQGTGGDVSITGEGTLMSEFLTQPSKQHSSQQIREACLQVAIGCDSDEEGYDQDTCLRTWKKPAQQ